MMLFVASSFCSYRVHTLKFYIDSNLEEAGEVEQRLMDKKEQYDKMVSLCKEERAQKARTQKEVGTGDVREGEDGDHDATAGRQGKGVDILPLGE